MANTDKDIIITPNIGASSDDPNIVFSGADASTSAQDISVFVYPANSGTLSFEGSSGQLFSVTNDLTGSIFSVNDISGIPSLEVNADGTVSIAEFDGEVGIGTSSPTEMLTIQGRDVASTDTGIRINSRGDAYLLLYADTSSDTENEQAYIYFSQDEDAVSSVIGTTPTTNQDSQGNTFTGSGNNSFAIHHKFATGEINIGVNGQVALTIDDSDNAEFIGHVEIRNSAPKLIQYETDGSADNKLWDQVVATEQLLFRIRADDDSTGASWMTVDRTGATTVDAVNFPGATAVTMAGKLSINRAAGGESILIKDTGGAGVVANPTIGFDDSANVRQGYVGFGSTGNQDIYLLSDLGDVRIVAGGGDIRLEDNVTVTGNVTATTFIGALTGNASTATTAAAWTTTRTIGMSGDVASDSVNIDGSGNITITNTVVANDSHTHAFNNLTSKTSGTGNYTTTGDFIADNFESTGLGPLTTPGTDDIFVGGYGMIGDRSQAVYITNAHASGLVSIGTNGSHNTNTVATFGPSGMVVTEQLAVTSTTAGTAALLATNVGTANTIATFVGDSDSLVISTIGAGDYKIANPGQDNGIVFYDGSGGVRLRYNGVEGIQYDANGFEVWDAFKVANTSGSDYMQIAHDGTDINITHNATTDWNISGLSFIRMSNGLSINGGSNLLVTDSGGSDYIVISHDGTKSTINNLGASVMEFELTSVVEAQVQDSDLSTATSGMQVKDHSQTLRDVGFNHVKEISMTTANITLSNLHVGMVIRRTVSTAVILTMAAGSEFPIGSMCTIINHGTGSTLTISDGSEQMFIMNGDGSAPTDSTGFALAIGGVLTIWRQNTSVYYVWGAGIP